MGDAEMGTGGWIIPVLLLTALCGSYLLGLFSRVPAWCIAVLASTSPVCMFCIGFPQSQWQLGMMIIGGYVVMGCLALGVVCFWIAKFAQESARLGKELARTRAQQGRRS